MWKMSLPVATSSPRRGRGSHRSFNAAPSRREGHRHLGRRAVRGETVHGHGGRASRELRRAGRSHRECAAAGRPICAKATSESLGLQTARTSCASSPRTPRRYARARPHRRNGSAPVWRIERRAIRAWSGNRLRLSAGRSRPGSSKGSATCASTILRTIGQTLRARSGNFLRGSAASARPGERLAACTRHVRAADSLVRLHALCAKARRSARSPSTATRYASSSTSRIDSSQFRRPGGDRDRERAAPDRAAASAPAICRNRSIIRPRRATCSRSSAARPSISTRCCRPL